MSVKQVETLPLLDSPWHQMPLGIRPLNCPHPIGWQQATSLWKESLEQDKSIGISEISFLSPLYPDSFRQYIPPERRPAFLYTRGSPLPDEKESVSIVGTRYPSGKGLTDANSFASYLSLRGVRVVSGLALGIDSEAHRASLNSRTVAILGGSVGSVYPGANQGLADQIVASNGTLLSAYPSGQKILTHHFPQRNELIAALSSATIVIEGGQKSGASITARHALHMGKAVVVLTRDFRSSEGTGAIRLIQDGAVPCADEVECLEACFSRLGGYSKHFTLLPAEDFSLEDFQNITGLPPHAALPILQEYLWSKRVSRLKNGLFRSRDARR